MPRITRTTAWISLACLAALVIGVVTVAARGHAARDRLMRADPEHILDDESLAPVALRIGRDGFVAHCASCHGSGTADRKRGVPDLTDGDHLYGTGSVAEIEQIVLHGIRSGDPRGWNLASMPVYASARPSLAEPIPPMTPQQIRDVTEYLMLRHARATDQAAAQRGKALFAGNGGCWDCHGSDGGGDDAIGAPNLLDDVWLYGDGSPASIARSIAYGRRGMCPAFGTQLSPSDARAIAVYVASLSHSPKGVGE